MGIYKSLTTSDVILTPFKVNKEFSFKGRSELTDPDVGIDRYFGQNITSSLFISGSNPTGQTSIQDKKLVYNSIKQLYYSNYLFGKDGSPANLPFTNTDGTIVVEGGSGSYQPMYDNYLNDTLLANRLFPTSSGDQIGVISIPSNLFGEYIKPGTFELSYSGSVSGSSVLSGTIVDDENGNLLDTLDNSKVGDIIYQHGMVVITSIGTSITGSVYGGALYGSGIYGSGDSQRLTAILESNDVNISFQSNMTIYESQYKCTFSPNEYTISQNPSITQNSFGKLYDFATSSYFEPFITTVGLYNNANQLVAVGKLSQPLQSSNVTDTTILVNLDL